MDMILQELMNALLKVKSTEETVVCFLDDLAKLKQKDVDELMKFYRLSVTKGDNFNVMYSKIRMRMAELKQQDETRPAEQVPSVPPQTKTVGKEAPKPPQTTQGSIPPK